METFKTVKWWIAEVAIFVACAAFSGALFALAGAGLQEFLNRHLFHTPMEGGALVGFVVGVALYVNNRAKNDGWWQ